VIKGIINRNNEPVIKIKIGNKTVSCDAIIDTGFNGYLSIPQTFAEENCWYFL